MITSGLRMKNETMESSEKQRIRYQQLSKAAKIFEEYGMREPIVDLRPIVNLCDKEELVGLAVMPL